MPFNLRKLLKARRQTIDEIKKLEQEQHIYTGRWKRKWLFLRSTRDLSQRLELLKRMEFVDKERNQLMAETEKVVADSTIPNFNCIALAGTAKLHFLIVYSLSMSGKGFFGLKDKTTLISVFEYPVLLARG